MVVLVCGSRSFRDARLVSAVLSSLSGVSLVLSGDAVGADRFGAASARGLGLPVRFFLADWSRFGRSAGVIRNRQMLSFGCPDLVLAFFSPGDRSPGTASMVRLALAAGVAVREYCDGFCSFASGAVA